MTAQPTAAVPVEVDARPLAVVYLRVSTRDQAKRGGETEGFSIPAQRDACLRKAEALGAHVVEEFVDAGESAKSANRRQLQRMLDRVSSEPVAFVIVHKVDRLARNRADDVEINLRIRAAGASLVSCSENIDETPSGMLLHGIMSSIAEFYSRNLATEAKKGMRQKAKSGGTPTMAPFGYINTSERAEDGREIRTVVVDAERAQWVPWIYQQYATGEWTVGMIYEELKEQGVTSLPRPNRPSAPLAKSRIANILKSRYYLGIVTFEGVEYPGKHPALITEQLWADAQQARESRVQSQEKPRIRTHYLKGSVFCGECGEPLSYEITRNRQGVYYEYFYCLGRQVQKNGCSFIATQAHRVEELVEDHWQTIQYSEQHLADVRQIVWAHIETVLPRQSRERAQAEKQLLLLERQADKLLQAYYADAVTAEQLRSEQARIAAGRAIHQQVLSRLQVAEETLKENLESACALLSRSHAQYLAADHLNRRDLNQAVFERIYILDDEVVGCDFTPAFNKLLNEDLEAQLAKEAAGPSRPIKALRLVEERLEPQPAMQSESGYWVPRHARTISHAHRTGRERPHGFLPWESKNPRPHKEAEGSNVNLLVGLTVFWFRT